MLKKKTEKDGFWSHLGSKLGAMLRPSWTKIDTKWKSKLCRFFDPILDASWIDFWIDFPSILESMLGGFSPLGLLHVGCGQEAIF